MTAQSDSLSDARRTAPAVEHGELELNTCRGMATSPISGERMPEVRISAVLKRTLTTPILGGDAAGKNVAFGSGHLPAAFLSRLSVGDV